MLFNSSTFLIFLLFVLFVYYQLNSWSIRKLLLLLSSYIFYAAWNPPFVLLLWISTIIDWNAAKFIHLSTSSIARRGWLVLSLLTNLGLLAFFKYGNFLLENISFLSGYAIQVDHMNIILPVGISFYTFQTLSYTIDIYKGEQKPWKSFLDYALYVTFFPQLVAGPIVRSHEFLDQCVKQKKLDWDDVGFGTFWLIVGLFLKIVIADYFMAPLVEKVYTTDGVVGFISAWVGTMAFSMQILCDFAGYSICAIGIAKMLGFYLPKNFRFPYAATGFSDFWRRWHISLSTWLRDYLYIPLGGNRRGDFRTYQNLMMTMLIGGLWHGAAWTFVLWGGLHGFYLMIERALKARVNTRRIPAILRTLGVYLLVCITWVFFRANTFEQAGNMVLSMVGVGQGALVLDLKSVAIVMSMTALMLWISWSFRNWDLEMKIQTLKWWQFSGIVTGLLYCIITLPGEDRSFIYFQF